MKGCGWDAYKAWGKAECVMNIETIYGLLYNPYIVRTEWCFKLLVVIRSMVLDKATEKYDNFKFLW